MNLSIKVLFFLCFCFTSCTTTITFTPGHSHNDYENDRPLENALENHFKSIEVDVYLIEDELIVSHNYPDPKNTNTLETQYLEPLSKKILENNGKIFKGQKEPLFLLVDIKSPALGTYEALKFKLLPYHTILSNIDNGILKEKAVKIIISGNRPIEKVLSEDSSYIFLDGRPQDLNLNISSKKMPMISQNFRSISSWNGEGKIDEKELNELKSIVVDAHKQGKVVRFWGSPDRTEVWYLLLDLGIDLINTDEPEKFFVYYNSG
jgi:hypothetical protein